jgi:peptidylprolyl isomerase
MVSSIFPVVGQSETDVVASSGAISLRAADIERALALYSDSERHQILNSPPALDRFIREELIRRVLIEEAYTKGWHERPSVVAAMERAQEQALVASYMNNLTQPPDEYPDEAAVRAFYGKNQALFVRPRAYRIAQIYLAMPSGADPQTEAAVARRAAELAKLVAAPGAGFAALAHARSEHVPSAANGGDMGWLSEHELIPEIRVAVANLAKGVTSGPVRTAEGWHVLKLLDERPGGMRSLEEAREAILNTLRSQRTQENERAYLDELLRRVLITVDTRAVQRLHSLAT